MNKKINKERIERDGIGLIEEFSRMLERIPEGSEMHYVLDLRNITRGDEKAKRKKFREKFKKIVPRWEENYVVAEKLS
ncbi:MAG: Asp-tRNA(Asn) amidotransferase GatCAB subunit C [Candidatus Altiarchaeales archaeon]|nr:MAG: Asp-tRNA(Asn) amidotransferase GatCAB subunit C [Candidatus Altiarchaeales archaeon]